MPIEVDLPDGSVVEFPDGTPNSVMESALAAHSKKAAWKPRQRSPQDLRDMAEAHALQNSPNAGKGWLERATIGAGRTLQDTIDGLGQIGAAITGGGMVPQREKLYADSVQRADMRQHVDAPLQGDLAAMGGSAVGVLSQLLAPGLAATRYASAAPETMAAIRAASLPRTLPGAGVQGAALGAVQPVGSDGSRAMNAGGGGLAGLAGAGIPRAASGLTSLVARPFRQVTSAGVDRRAADVLRAEAADAASLMKPQPSAVPGVQRTLAEESLDPGIARLERNARSTGRNFDTIDRTNNAARVEALGSIAGDSKAIRQAEAVRKSLTDPLLTQAKKMRGVDIGPVAKVLDDLAQKNAPRKAVVSAIDDVRDSLAAADDSIESLYQVRKNIDDLLSGKAGMDKSYAKAARRELMAVKDALDRQMAEKSPQFAKYLKAYRQASIPIDRMRIGQRVAQGGSAIPDPVTGQQVLTAASFSRKAGDLDAVAAKATGFKRAKADDYLGPEDMQTIGNVQDDLTRRSFAATAGSGGNSQTFERMAAQDRLGGSMASKIPVLGAAVGELNRLGQRRLEAKLAEVLANPQQARELLGRMPAKDRQAILMAISRAGGVVGGTGAVLKE